MDAFIRQTIFDIMSLRVQGASQVQKAGIRCLQWVGEHSVAASFGEFQQEVHAILHALLKARPTEPNLRTALWVVTHDLSEQFSVEENKQQLVERCKWFEQESLKTCETIAELGASLLPKSCVVFTHCHSHTVEAVLKEARHKVKMVYATETRPLFQGRITAENLVKAKIPVVCMVDSAATRFMKEADILLTGCDAITCNGNVINKIGTRMISNLALSEGIPHVVCSSGFAFDPLTCVGWKEPVEERDWKEVWPEKPDLVKIVNPAFDETPRRQVKKIVSQYGVLSPSQFVKKMTRVFNVEREKASFKKLAVELKKS